MIIDYLSAVVDAGATLPAAVGTELDKAVAARPRLNAEALAATALARAVATAAKSSATPWTDAAVQAAAARVVCAGYPEPDARKQFLVDDLRAVCAANSAALTTVLDAAPANTVPGRAEAGL